METQILKRLKGNNWKLVKKMKYFDSPHFKAKRHQEKSWSGVPINYYMAEGEEGLYRLDDILFKAYCRMLPYIIIEELEVKN